jgi:hypothetical protein
MNRVLFLTLIRDRQGRRGVCLSPSACQVLEGVDGGSSDNELGELQADSMGLSLPS